jgi:NDP-sugar pyrophosphorylase family protein
VVSLIEDDVRYETCSAVVASVTGNNEKLGNHCSLALRIIT